MAAFEDSSGRRAPGGRGQCAGLDVAGLLARWRSREVPLAGKFQACGGASEEEIEELYDDTVAALLAREGDVEYESELHLRRALHRGIKMRALRMHRDRARRRRTLEAAAPVVEAQRVERDWRMQPERSLVAREDDIVIGEFVSELTEEERGVFALVAAGRSWRAIATALGLEEPRARALTRACERKRERFLALYETGRLCGYRSRTIGLLLVSGGPGGSELAFGQAVAHLRHCRRCQAAHGVDAAGLRARFDGRVAVFLPGPVLVGRDAGGVGAWGERVWAWGERVWRAPSVGGRERLVEVAAGSSAGVGIKVAGGLATLAMLAGSAVSLGGLAAHRKHTERQPVVVRTAAPTAQKAASAAAHERPSPSRVRASRVLPKASEQRTSGGFSYLGAPERRQMSAPVVNQRGGSPFSP